MNKKKILITIIPLMFIIGLLLNIPIKNTQAITQNIDYVFENNIIFNETNPISFENSNNFRNEQEYTDYYNSTYDFNNESIGTNSTDIDFIDIDNTGVNCIAIINESNKRHNNILDLHDSSGSEQIEFYNNINNQEFGTYEFWYQITDAELYYILAFMDGATTVFAFSSFSDKFEYYDSGGWHDIIGIIPIDNIWFHLRFDFECTVGSYEGLSQYEWNIYINNVEYGSYSFGNNQPHLDNAYYRSGITQSGYEIYMDGIGISWDVDYSIGQNILPYSFSLDNIEIANWMFTYDDNGNLYTDGTDNPDSWIDIESGADRVGIDLIGFEGFYVIDQFSYGSDIGFNKDDFNITDGIIEINITINICLIGLSGSLITNVYSYDTTEIVRIKMYPEASSYKLDYFNGSDYNNLYIFDNESSFNYADFHFYIINNLIIIEMTIDDYEINELFYFPIIVSGKKGMSEIKVMSDVLDDSRQQKIRYESIGVYINGSSIVIDSVYSIYEDFKAITNTDLNYIIVEINATGIFSIGILDVSFNYIQVINATEYSGYTKTIRYNISDNLIWINPVRIKIIYNSSYTLNYLDISTCYLKESTNIYPLQFNFNNVNKDQNYFHVVNNRLYFHVDLNNYSYEGISATFNIPEISTINGTISFINFYSGHIAPYLCLNYTYSDISYFQFKNYPNQIKHILPQNQYLYQFIINVSDYIVSTDDNYTNHNSGFISGYIQNIKLGYIPDISLTITTLNLISVLVPIMFIFIPTLMIQSIYGKSTIFPIILLMSIINLASGLIQGWLFFIIAYCSFIFLITQRKKGLIE